MEDLASVAGGPIKQHGMAFSVTMGLMAEMQREIPVKDDNQPFLSVGDVIAFCASPMGMELFLEKACIENPENLEALSSPEKIKLTGTLVKHFVGGTDDADPGTPGEGGSEPQAPLVEPSEIGS